MKKMFITGHRRGIGKNLTEFFSKKYEIIVSDAYDINDVNSIDHILSLMADSDIIINNAYGNSFAQTELLYLFYENFSQSTKHFIDIQSINIKLSSTKGIPQSKYSVHKTASNYAIKHLQQFSDRSCTLTALCPSITDTDYNRNKDVVKMSTTDVSRVVELVLEFRHQLNIEIKEIVFGACN